MVFEHNNASVDAGMKPYLVSVSCEGSLIFLSDPRFYPKNRGCTGFLNTLVPMYSELLLAVSIT